MGRANRSNASMETCIDPSAGKTNELAGGPVGNELISSEEAMNSEPYMGMLFESDEAAKRWYNDYARHVGFSIRVGCHECSQRTREIISRQYLCSREGSCDKRSVDRKDRIRLARPNMRVGCKAMIMVKKRDTKKWVVTRLEKTHNHELVGPDKVMLLRSHRHGSSTLESHVSVSDRKHKLYDKDADFERSCSRPIVKTQSPMEEQVAEIYTRSMFLKFQEELCVSLRYIAIKIKEDGELSTYKVTKFGEENRSYTVTLNVSKTRVSCTCQMIEFVRILCRHALIVFRLANILVLPSHYIVERYKRNGKSGPACDENDITTHDDSRESLMLRFSYLCHQAVKYAEEGSTSVDVYDVAVRALRRRSLEKVLAAKRNAAMDAQFPNPLSGSILDDNLDGGNQTDHSTNQITLLNQCTSSRECPASCRMPHILEKHPNRTRTGAMYGVNGHDDSGCSTLTCVRISSDTEIPSARFDMHDPPALEFWSFHFYTNICHHLCSLFIDAVITPSKKGKKKKKPVVISFCYFYSFSFFVGLSFQYLFCRNIRWPENSSHPNIHRLT